MNAKTPSFRSEMTAEYFNHRGAGHLPDTSCGNTCAANLPQGASGFTTIELRPRI